MNTNAISTLRDDPALAPLIQEHGPLDLEQATDTFERLVVAIIRQQVSVEAAAAIRERVFEQFEINPAAIAAADPERLNEAGLSTQKASYVQSVAEAYLENDYGHDYFAGMSDQAVLDELTEIRGVGAWTGKIYLMFCLGREDVFPVEDLGIRRGMQTLYGDDMDRSDMRDTAERWRPYRSYASLYLWRLID